MLQGEADFVLLFPASFAMALIPFSPRESPVSEAYGTCIGGYFPANQPFHILLFCFSAKCSDRFPRCHPIHRSHHRGRRGRGALLEPGITDLISMGKGSVQSVRPAGMPSDNHGMQILGSQLFLQRHRGTRKHPTLIPSPSGPRPTFSRTCSCPFCPWAVKPENCFAPHLAGEIGIFCLAYAAFGIAE